MGGRRRRRDRTPSYSDYYSDYSYSPSPTPERKRRKRRSRRDESRGRRRKGGKRKSSVDKFIKENELNDSAAARLRGAAREVREGVLEQGWNVIDNARNASAVVISRIKKLEDAIRDGGGGGGGGGGGRRGRSRSRSRSPPPRGGGGGGGGGGPDFRHGDWTCKACGGHNFARRTECFKCNASRDGDRSRSRHRSRSRS
eukprot:TRINITY_DN5421_c0_g1_i1.p1 TRINITY_DN5421_c0_g1~~TRINITY_DN5421_c0_g1_i1.p1  ORF type:complete len:199 (+),score=18.05 TRINITY_DN5421_c0_g1_i1:117-713(+)